MLQRLKDVFSATFAICAFGAPGLAHAAPSEASAAQALFDDAKALMARGQFSEACPKLQESQRLDPALGTLLNLADCREKEGNLATAWSAFREAEGVARREGHGDAEQVARARAQALFARVPRLIVEVASDQPRGFRLTRNDVEVGAPQWGAAIPIDPGRYVIVASAPGHREFRASATLEDGGRTVTVSVPRLEASVSAAQPLAGTASLEATQASAGTESGGASIPTATWILGGIGIAGMGAGLGLGAWAKSQYDSADCPEHVCASSEALGERNAARTKATAATVVFIAGSAALAGGITIWALSPKGTKVRAGLGSVSVTQAW